MNIKKTTLVLATALCLGTTCAYAKTMEFTMNDTNLNVLDNTVTSSVLETAPYTSNDRTMVPVRVIAENFGANIDWNEDTKEVTITKDTKKIILTLDNSTAKVNDEEIVLDVAPCEINGRTMVPLRFISETLGYNVKYIESTEQVNITDNPVVLSINGNNITTDDYSMIYNINLNSIPNITDEDKSQLAETIYTNLKDANYFSLMAKENNLQLSPEELQAIKSVVESSTEIDSTKMLKSTYAGLLETFQKARMYSTGLSALATPTEDDINNYYKDNYVCIKHILLLNETKNAKQTIANLKTKLTVGADFDELMKQYSEDTGLQSYPDGYVFTKGKMVEEFEKVAYKLKIGEISDVVKTSYGYHILKRLELPEISDEVKYEIENIVGNDNFSKIVNEDESKANINELISKDDLFTLLNK